MQRSGSPLAAGAGARHGEQQPLLHFDWHSHPPPCYTPPDETFTVFPSAPPDDADQWLPTARRPAKPSRAEPTNWCGVLLAFLSGAFFTLASAGVKALRSISPMELLLVRGALQVLVMLPVACRCGQSLLGPPGLRLLLQLQGLVGGVNLALLFFSFRRLPLGDATTIIFSAPVLVMVLSCIFLKEPCGFFRTLIVFLLLTGVVLIAKPPFIFQTSSHEHYDVVGYACAVAGTVFSALNIVVMRRCKQVHFSVLVLHLSAWCVLSAAAVLGAGAALGRWHGGPPWGRGTAPGLHQWALAVGVSACGLLGQVLVARALAREGAARVAVTRSLDIVLAFVLQVAVFGDLPDWMSVTGATIVITCVLAMGLEEHIQRVASLVP